MDAHEKPPGLRTQQLSTVREKKTPHGSLEGTIQAKLRLQGATEPDAFEDGKVGDGDVLWPSITIFFQPLI